MPTVKEILGDELAVLLGQGKSNDEIKQIATERFKNPPPPAIQNPTQKEQTPKTIFGNDTPAWYMGQSESGIANLAGDFLRGTGHTGLSYANLLPLGDAFHDKTTNLLQKLESVTEQNKAKDRTPERKAEAAALQKQYGDATTFSDKLKAGFNSVADTLTNPKEWQVGEFIGQNLDPINVIPAGKGIIAGATIGGIVNATQAAAFDAPRSDKSGLDTAVDATLGGVAGVALGGVTGGLTKESPKASKQSDYNAAKDGLGINDAVSGKVMPTNKTDAPIVPAQAPDAVTPEAEIVKQKSYDAFAKLVNKEEASVSNVDAVVKSIGSEMEKAGATPEQIELRVADELKPSLESLAISNVLNDGLTLTPRLSGLNMQQAIINSIENSSKSSTQFYEAMLIHGATPEHARAATLAYDAKDISPYATWAHDKLSANIDKIVDMEGVKKDTQKHIENISKGYQNDILPLAQHERFDELLDMTRNLESSEDFTLTKAKVTRIEGGRATQADIESLKSDLAMIENNPKYAPSSEDELRARYDAQAKDSSLIYDYAEFDKLEQRFDPQLYAEKQELFGDITKKEEINSDTNYARDLARDSQYTAPTNENYAAVNGNERGADNAGLRQAQGADGAVGISKQSDNSTPDNSTTLLGERSDTNLPEQNTADTTLGSISPDIQPARSGGADGSGILPEQRAEAPIGTEPKQEPKQSSNDSLDSGVKDITERIAAQKEAEFIPAELNNPKNIHDTLPMLLKEQREDVIKAEKRFYELNERGMLFTNGTGTGKTFTGLGMAKRFEKMGKKDIVILVPSEAKAIDWIEDAKLVNLNIRKLKDTKDSGEGSIVVTTYENFRDNAALRVRSVDLLISDESHKIMGNKDGKYTNNLDAIREITGYYENAKAKAREQFAPQKEKINAQIEKVGNYSKEALPLKEQLKELEDQEQLLAREINSKTKTLFLSASPFASHKSLRYADDYLFNFEKDKWAEKQYNGAYNAGSAEDNFFMSNFGYNMRYNKLTRPDAEVNVDMMERTFSEKLRESGAMSGRMLNVDKDYQRAFVLVDSEIGKKIDAGFELLNDDKEFTALRGVMRASYMDTVSLMESIKAQEAIPRVKAHLEAGRKVVIYHTFVDAVPSHPFRLERHIDAAVSKATAEDFNSGNAMRKKLDAEYSDFKTKYPELYSMDLGDLASPTDIISRAFGADVVMFNRLAGKSKGKNKDLFNNNIVDIIMVNESGKEGISLHDKLGDKQRVTINLTLPIKPIDMIQVEGRTYRTGQKSDAIFEYLTLHTNFEKRYFGSSINERVATVENLAMGEQSRNLRSSIKDGYMNAEVIEPHALDGKGGKAFDARAEGDKVMGNPFTYAKTLYFGKQKGRQNHKGNDFFATPDPLGFKMVEWADIKANDKVLEPSAGVGAIGKWFPANSVNSFIEQSGTLFSDLTVAVQGKVQQMDFMDLDIHNKYDAIVMNPPFGQASVTAIEHLQKAMSHTSLGGRIVILAPNNMMEKASFKKMLEEKAFSGWVLQDEIKLPEVAFERAGTKVMTSVYVFNKTSSKDMLNITNRYTNDIQADNINSLFDDIESMNVDRREVPRAYREVDAEIATVLNTTGIKIETHVHTKTGADMTVVRLNDKLEDEVYMPIANEIRKHGGYWSRVAKGFIFKDEAKAQRFKDGVNDGSVRLNAMFVPYAAKIADVMLNFDKYADKAYNFVSDFVRDVDSEGVPKAFRESKNVPHAMANNFFGWLRDNMVLGGGRANHYLEVLRDYTNMKGRIAQDALDMREALNHLSKDDSTDLVRALGGDLPPNELNVGMMPIYEKFRAMIDAQTDELIKAGALDEQYAKNDYVKRYYFEHIAKEKSFVNMKGSEAHSVKYARADMTLEERIALGQVEDASYVVAKTIMEQRDQLNRAKFFTKLANEVGSSEAMDGFVKVPDTKAGIINKWGDLNNKYIPKQVWDDLRGSAKMYDELSGIEQFVAAWMSGIQHIKTNMTVKNLGTHLYNILSNGYIAYLDGHLTHLGRVVKDRGLYKQLHDEANRFGLDSMLDDLEGVAFKEHSEDGVLTSLLKNAYMAEGTKVGDAMRKAYAHEDAAFKIAAYLKRKEQLQLEKFLAAAPELKAEYDRGMLQEYMITNRYAKDIQSIALNEDEMRSAFEGVDEVYVNYGTPLPAGVKNLDRSGLFPFMHYTWKATPIFMKQMMRHPYKVAMLHVAAGSYGLSKIWGEQDERDKVTPAWMNEGFNLFGLDNYKEVKDGEYLNVGRTVPGMRFMDKSPISLFLGMDGGILANMLGIAVQGRDNKGFSVDGGKYDSEGVQFAKRASATAEQAMPPLFPALPLVVRPKLDSNGKEVKDTTEIVAFGGRYFQKAYDALGGKKDKRDNPIEIVDVAKQAVGIKLQKIDKLQYAQMSINTARKLYEREYNIAKGSMERTAAMQKYKSEIAKVKSQTPANDVSKLKIKSEAPGASDKVFKKFVTKGGLIKL